MDIANKKRKAVTVRIHRAPHRIFHNFRKRWYKNQTTAPRLSADAFRGICDVSFYCEGDDTYTTNALRDMRVVYCNSDHLEEFLAEDLPRFTPKVLLVGNSDRDFTDLDVPSIKGVKAVFLQNSTINGEPFHILPIGIENVSLAMSGRPKYFKNAYLKTPKTPNILVGPFGNTHIDRQILKELNQAHSEPVFFREDFMKPSLYAKLSSSFSYVACPRGNGLDTHRFWETLYRGGIPVVIESDWSRNISRLGVPLVSIPNWDLNLLRNIVKENNGSLVDPNFVKSLWLPYWIKRFNDLI